MRSPWFDYTELCLTTSSQEEQGVVGTYTQIPGVSTARNIIELPHVVSVEEATVV